MTLNTGVYIVTSASLGTKSTAHKMIIDIYCSKYELNIAIEMTNCYCCSLFKQHVIRNIWENESARSTGCNLAQCLEWKRMSSWFGDSFYVSLLASSISCSPCVLGFRLCVGCAKLQWCFHAIVQNCSEQCKDNG